MTTLQSCIQLLELTLGDMSSGDADRIVEIVIGLLKDETN